MPAFTAHLLGLIKIPAMPQKRKTRAPFPGFPSTTAGAVYYGSAASRLMTLAVDPPLRAPAFAGAILRRGRQGGARRQACDDRRKGGRSPPPGIIPSSAWR